MPYGTFLLDDNVSTLTNVLSFIRQIFTALMTTAGNLVDTITDTPLLFAAVNVGFAGALIFTALGIIRRLALVVADAEDAADDLLMCCHTVAHFFLGDFMEYISNLLNLFAFLFSEAIKAFIFIIGLVIAGGVFGGVINLIRRLISGLIYEEV